MTASDTSADVKEIQRAAWMSKSGPDRVAIAFEMNAVARSIAISGIRSRRPGISQSELAIELIDRMHGPVTTVEVSVLSKLELQRESASTTQRRDVVEMLRATRDQLDLAYLQHWATQLRVSEILLDVLSEAGVSS